LNRELASRLCGCGRGSEFQLPRVDIETGQCLAIVCEPVQMRDGEVLVLRELIAPPVELQVTALSLVAAEVDGLALGRAKFQYNAETRPSLVFATSRPGGS
jgi:hypothetical protein